MDDAEFEEKQEESPQAEEKPPKSKKKFVLILASFLVVLASAVLGAYFGGVFASDTPAEDQQAQQEPYPEVNQTMVLDPLVIQLSDKGRKPRFVRLSLTLGICVPEENEEDVDFSEDPLFKPRLQDRLIFSVGAKSSQDLASLEGREALKSELLKEVSRIFPEKWGEVLEIYVTELLIQ